MVPTLSQRSDSMSSLSDTEHTRWVRPSFLSKLDDIRVKEGEDTTFRSRVSGDPHPKVRWYHNGKMVKKSEHIRHVVKVRLLNQDLISYTTTTTCIYFSLYCDILLVPIYYLLFSKQRSEG